MMDACLHARSQLWRLTLRNGVEQVRPVCQDCHYILGAVAKHTLGEGYASLPRGSYEEARERYHTRWERDFEERQRQKRSAFFAEYSAYLRSPTWCSLRQRVLRRANGVCEACLERRATQVHHRTYDHVFAEFAFELAAVCDACHARLHPREDEAAA
jgi:hypothetical protein